VTPQLALTDEIEGVITHGSAQRRAEILLQVTDLFIAGSGRFSEDEISLFDDVIVRLAAEIEVSVRATLASRLAPVAKAPVYISKMLASDSEIRVAGPILTLSERLDKATLVTAARTQSQEHLLAISLRKSLGEEVTDVLVERGNQEVVLRTAQNLGATFSNSGFSLLVKRSVDDDTLTTCVGSRPDLPHKLFLTLLATASELVRAKLISEHPKFKREINAAVTAVAEQIQNETGFKSRAWVEAQESVEALRAAGPLTDSTIRTFAEQEKLEEIITSISVICSVPLEIVERTIVEGEVETLLILAKASELSWGTTKLLLALRSKRRGITLAHIEQNMASFERLSASTARKIIEFYRMRRSPVLNDDPASRNTEPKTRLVSALEHTRLKQN
jgi:uncharacterized protein (DUF2336 family)